MAIDFPSSPTTNQTVTVGSKTWVYDGAKWNSRLVTSVGPTGPQGASANRNVIINGAFDIWQRGTSLSAADAFRFLADRWGTGTVSSTIAPSQQTFTPGNAISGYEPSFFHRTVVASANNAGSVAYVYQKVEDVRTFAGQTVTLSFWAKADSNKSIAIELVQDFGSGGSTFTTSANKISITSSWARYTYTFTWPSISGKTIGTGSHLGIYLWMDAGSSWNSRTNSLGNQSGTFDIWGVQLEAGSTATTFQRNSPSLQAELAACQRYYWRFTSEGATGNYMPFGMAHGIDANAARGIINYPVTMRRAPDMTFSAASTFMKSFGNPMTSIVAAEIGVNAGSFQVGRTGEFSANQGALITASNTKSAFIELSAEL